MDYSGKKFIQCKTRLGLSWVEVLKIHITLYSSLLFAHLANIPTSWRHGAWRRNWLITLVTRHGGLSLTFRNTGSSAPWAGARPPPEGQQRRWPAGPGTPMRRGWGTWQNVTGTWPRLRHGHVTRWKFAPVTDKQGVPQCDDILASHAFSTHLDAARAFSSDVSLVISQEDDERDDDDGGCGDVSDACVVGRKTDRHDVTILLSLGIYWEFIGNVGRAKSKT